MSAIWKTSLIRSKDGVEDDWYVCNPGPEMRHYLRSCFGPRWGHRVYMVITHLPSGKEAKAQIIKDRRVYRAKYNRELLTLEATAKIMKEDLRLHGR